MTTSNEIYEPRELNEDREWWLIRAGYRVSQDGYITHTLSEELKVWDGREPLLEVRKNGTQLHDWLQQRGVKLDHIHWEDKEDHTDCSEEGQEIWLLKVTPEVAQEVVETFGK